MPSEYDTVTIIALTTAVAGLTCLILACVDIRSTHIISWCFRVNWILVAALAATPIILRGIYPDYHGGGMPMIASVFLIVALLSMRKILRNQQSK